MSDRQQLSLEAAYRLVLINSKDELRARSSILTKLGATTTLQAINAARGARLIA